MENIPKITYTNSRRGKKMIIADQIYPFNLIYIKKTEQKYLNVFNIELQLLVKLLY